ncbi:site-specific DNA-methyltransferase [Bacillus altitudinis]|uniref:site-specific DNA-methyltransferase n=1 Tax=Bacillus altitudinis TaxID=293387 RepID=UPI00119E3574|nr:site-specific DNA-methyltransferase [Bacillus altitudinis]
MSYELINEHCFIWLKDREEDSIDAIGTDPPYGVKEYTPEEIEKRRQGTGGIWRIPSSMGGVKRQPVPRFSVINDDPKLRQEEYDFFFEWGKLALRVLKPGGHLIIAFTSLLSDIMK